ncbi:MAG: triosephosphate isomerase, partial [Legionellales bacterium]|nr:triosephosphate isomerase [Legionellales bacterium]
MMRPIFAANWKMNGSLESITQLLNSLTSRFVDPGNSEIIIFPPSTYLLHTKNLLSNLNWYLGGQDVSNFDQGAYTGEIAASMLRDLGCGYVLVGHSERRHIIGESCELVAQKFSKALEHKLIP